MTADVPRLDYLGSSCPSLLLEPQRTNLALYSEQFDNAAWTKTNCTVLANQTSSPSGYVDADEVTTTSTLHALFAVATVTASTAYTFSFYVKRGTMTDLAYRVFNVTAGTNIVAPTSYYSQTTASGWSRITLTFTTPVGCTSARVDLVANSGVTGTVYVWGAQLEAGSYPTSYIPTLGTSVTRVADVAIKTGISSLIGQTQGTLFIETEAIGLPTVDQYYMAISDGTTSNNIYIGFFASILVARISNSGSLDVNINASLSANTKYKIAFAYKENDCVLYINGVNSGDDTSTAIPATSKLSFNDFGNESGYKVNQSVLFPTRLSNSELASLTSL
jgi:hypothetical protein